MVNTSILSQVNALTALRDKSGFGAAVAPVMYLALFISFPFLANWFLSKNVDRMTDIKDREFRERFGSIYQDQKMQKFKIFGFGVLVVNVRKTIYSILLVTLHKNPAVLIVMIQQVSIIMTFINSNYKFYSLKEHLHNEYLNEGLIIIITYHLMLVSDMVPYESNEDHKVRIGYSMIIFIMFGALWMIVSIVYGTIKTLLYRLYIRNLLFKRRKDLIALLEEKKEALK